MMCQRKKTRPDNNASVKSVLSEVTKTTSITTRHWFRSSLTDSLLYSTFEVRFYFRRYKYFQSECNNCCRKIS